MYWSSTASTKLQGCPFQASLALPHTEFTDHLFFCHSSHVCVDGATLKTLHNFFSVLAVHFPHSSRSAIREMSSKPDTAEIRAAQLANDAGFTTASDKPRTFSFSPEVLRELNARAGKNRKSRRARQKSNV